MNLHQQPRTKGFTLIEILIALAVFGLGVLGVTALTTQSQKITHRAYQSMIATWQLHDMMELIRANASEAIGSNSYEHNGYVDATPAEDDVTDCTTNECSASEMAVYDKHHWLNHAATSLPFGRGWFTKDISGTRTTYTLTLYWDGKQTNSTDTPESDCAQETTLLCQSLKFEL